MQISPVNTVSNSIYRNYSSKNNTQKGTAPNFTHHPDFVKLGEIYDITASNYFRQGYYYGCVSEQFKDVINSLKLFFNEKKRT